VRPHWPERSVVAQRLSDIPRLCFHTGRRQRCFSPILGRHATEQQITRAGVSSAVSSSFGTNGQRVADEGLLSAVVGGADKHVGWRKIGCGERTPPAQEGRACAMEIPRAVLRLSTRRVPGVCVEEEAEDDSRPALAAAGGGGTAAVDGLRKYIGGTQTASERSAAVSSSCVFPLTIAIQSRRASRWPQLHGQRAMGALLKRKLNWEWRNPATHVVWSIGHGTGWAGGPSSGRTARVLPSRWR